MEDYGGDLPQSEFRRSLLCIGEANEAVADLHKRFAENVKVTWLSHVEQNVKMMNAYQVCAEQEHSDTPAFRSYNNVFTLMF